MKKIEFEWPEFKKDRDRIRAYTFKYRNQSIADAFSEVYGLDLKQQDLSTEVVPCAELSVGDYVNARIISISKNHVDFDTSHTKTLLISNCNLYKYERFKHFIPLDEFKLKVISKTKNYATVDVLTPMIEDFIYPRVNAPWIQKDVRGALPILVKNLQLTRGGFTGKAVLPNVSEFVGEDYEVDAFIPGSQIVLNIAQNFEEFIGQDVWTFIINYTDRGNGQMSLICSAKEYLKYLGEMNMIQLFKDWTEDNDAWKKANETTLTGYVTGTMGNPKKLDGSTQCAVFIEVPMLNITGMVSVPKDEIYNYRTGMELNVQLDGFEEPTRYNPTTQQLQHLDPYVIEDNKIKKCNIKPILKLV